MLTVYDKTAIPGSFNPFFVQGCWKTFCLNHGISLLKSFGVRTTEQLKQEVLQNLTFTGPYIILVAE